MRTVIAALIALSAACSAEIAPGTYLCGPNGSCPEDLACDGETNTCVFPSQVLPFTCGSTTEVEPNDSLAGAQPMRSLTCVSQPAEVRGCGQDLDRQDWYRFEVPANCTAVGVTSRLRFPLAFEALELELVSSTGQTIASSGPCSFDEQDDGDVQRCLDQELTPGGVYALRVSRTGEGTCSGMCAYNHYTLTLQLETP